MSSRRAWSGWRFSRGDREFPGGEKVWRAEPFYAGLLRGIDGAIKLGRRKRGASSRFDYLKGVIKTPKADWHSRVVPWGFVAADSLILDVPPGLDLICGVVPVGADYGVLGQDVDAFPYRLGDVVQLAFQSTETAQGIGVGIDQT